MDLITFNTPGLGDNTYVVAHGETAVVIDPQRDFGRFLTATDGLGATVRMVFETHVHNDYVSGGLALAGAAGADLVLPAGAGAAFRFRPAFHHEDIDVGGITVRPLHTPGHTPEHVSYLVLIEDEPVGLFSGGSLLVGAAGRTDLLGMDKADSLARLQFGSIQRLATLPAEVGLYPTHGPGSFCSVSAVGGPSSTIGTERATNPLLAISDAETFAANQLSGLQPYPSYYRHIGPINSRGSGPIPAGPVRSLDPSQVAALMDDEVAVVDGRPRATVARTRIPSSWAIELGGSFATWVGWLLPFDQRLVLVLDDEGELDEARTALGRIGFTRIEGVLWGIDGWVAEGRPVASHPTVTAGEFVAAAVDPSQVLDVRAPDEWDDGHVEGSIHRHLPDLVESIPDDLDPDLPVYVGCSGGHRAAAAAAVLADAGYRPVAIEPGIAALLHPAQHPAEAAG